MGMQTGRTVYIVDDDHLVRESTEMWITNAGWSAIGFSDPLDFLNQLPKLPPGCVLLDMQMPGVNGLGVLEQAQAYLATHPTVVMTGYGDVATAVRTMKLGATDFLEKPFRRPDLLETLNLAFQKIDNMLAENPHKLEAVRLVSTLSPREADVLHGLMTGLSNKELARQLELSPRTVEMHRAHMMRRLGVRTLSDALKLGFVAELRSPG
ncbi:response regulator transcription factor [Sandarakinorhabdus oryzae]|uniref:response regulator transcription factor n=1 Tax=Sandarakinorhabdus oryzae TaxID=2675220 RepID=UPI0012E2F4D2|nr:response regulator [Sandarakinorhabdus oryzae]